MKANARAARVDRNVVRAIEEVLKPYDVQQAEAEIALLTPKATEWSGYAGALEVARSTRDAGGKVSTVLTEVRLGTGIQHTNRWGQIVLDLALIDQDYESCDLNFETSVDPKIQVNLWCNPAQAEATVEAPEAYLQEITQQIEALLKGAVDAVLLSKLAGTFKVFIGHGGDPQWKYLQRALSETHGMAVEAFESSERAGYHTLVVVDEMVRESTVAVVVMTGEDLMEDGSRRARENVIHEVGFCQGALGIDRTIVVMEEGVSEPSNIAGLTQIRFPRGELINVEDRIVDALIQRKRAFEYSLL